MHLSVSHVPLGRRFQWASFSIGSLHKRRPRDFVKFVRFALVASAVIVGVVLSLVAFFLLLVPATETSVEHRPVLWIAFSLGTGIYLVFVGHSLARLIHLSMVRFSQAVLAAIAEREKDLFDEIERELFGNVEEA